MNLDVINDEISKLEGVTPTYASIERLAWLYIVRDHNTAIPQDATVRSGQIVFNGDTDFCKAVHGKDEQCVISLMDELMTTLRQIYPKLYEAVMEKL